MAINLKTGTAGAKADTVAGLRAVQRSGVTGALSGIASKEPGTWVQVWLDALYVFVATRVLFLGLTYLAPALLGNGNTKLTVLGALRSWFTQDATHFSHIAQFGYDAWWRTAFFPLFPLLEHIFAPLFGGDYGMAGLVIANASYLGTLVVLRDLIGRDFEPDVARRTILYLSIFPTAFYYFAPYSESLYLLLSIGAFSALRRRQWWLAGALGGLAVLARSQSIALLVPFAVELIAAVRYGVARWWQILWAALIPAGLGVYAAYLAVLFHDPLAFSHAQAYWDRGLHWPWESLTLSIGVLTSGGKFSSVVLTHLLLNLGAIVVFIALAVPVVRRLPRSYGLYAVTLLLYFLLFSVQYGAVSTQGDGRFVAGLFPIFVLVALWGRNQRVHELLIIGQVALLTLLSLHFLFHANWGQGVLWG